RIQVNLTMNFRHLMTLSLEPLASPEEVAEYEIDEAVAEDELTARKYVTKLNRFEGHVDVLS
ncbi:Hypothetical predicted protein, partial [Paramuricea clavata]